MRLWSLILLALVVVGLRAGEESAPTTTPAPAPVAVEAPASAPTPAPATTSVTTSAATTPVAAVTAPAAPVVYELINDLVQVEILNHQGAIRSMSLLKSHPIHLRLWQTRILEQKGQRSLEPSKPLPVLSAFNPYGSYHNFIRELGLNDKSEWKRISGDARHLVLSHVTPDQRLRYTIAYELPEKSLSLQSTFTIENLAGNEVAVRPYVYPLNGIHQDDVSQDAAYLALAHHNGGSNGKMVSLYLPPVPTMGAKVENTAIPTQQLDYVCLKSRFFAAIWQPLSFSVLDANTTAPAPVAPVLVTDGGPGAKSGGPGGPGGPLPVAAGANTGLQVTAVGFIGHDHAHQAYIEVALLGPASSDILLKPAHKLQASWSTTVASMTSDDLELIGPLAAKVEYTDGYYRFFKSLAWLLTISLDFLVLMVVNYGFAVVVLTFLIKLILHRFTFKQHESMMKMQKLAPDLKLLQEQYKNDKQKMAQKQMELWKKHGVNPLGGCLPIFIQIPIFTALYLAFCHSADMRGHGFLWVNDLTLPDQVIGWVVGGWTLSINPLPIIYIGVSIWMSLMQKVPPGADPQQEQMMKTMRWLPVLFGVIFYNFPSGLVLYFTINAVLSTIEIKMVRKKLGMH